MIIIIDNYDSFTYNLYQSVARHDNDVRVFRNDKITVDAVKQLNPNGIILSPGPGRPENSGICVDLVKQLSPQIPIIGVCLGHQAIAVAFGAQVIQANEIMHGKADFIFHDQAYLFAHMPMPFKAGRYHSLIVEKSTLPAELMIQAENNNGIIMGIKHIHYPCYGIQFHPESILTPEGDIFLNHFIESCQQQPLSVIAC